MLAQGVAESLSRSVRVNIEASVVLLRDEFPCRRVEDESPKPDGLLAGLELQMDAGAEDADRPVLVLDEPVQARLVAGESQVFRCRTHCLIRCIIGQQCDWRAVLLR